MNASCVLYFVKYPEPGKVKTRLARSVGPEKAAAIYRSLAEENYKKLESLAADGIDRIVTFDPPEKDILTENWLPEACHYVPQQGRGLGERLRNAFLNAFEAGYTRVAAVGSDTIDLDTHDIRRGFSEMQNREVVLGPASDGGYWFIGLSGRYLQLFDNIPWSTAEVLKATEERAIEHRYRIYRLPMRSDLDDAESLKPA